MRREFVAADVGGWEDHSSCVANDARGCFEMTGAETMTVIRALFAAYLAHDRQAVESSFTDDFRFTSPYDDAIDKPAYFERCWRAGDWIERHDLERIVVDGDAAFVTYRCLAKDGKSFRNTEFFVFEDNRIRSIDVYFGATYEGDRFVKQNPS
jgi:ketosteroid isomerase-like protein